MKFNAVYFISMVSLVALASAADSDTDMKERGYSYNAPAPANSYSAPAPAPSYSAPAAPPAYSAPVAVPAYAPAPAPMTIPAPPCPKNYLFSCQPTLTPAPCSSPVAAAAAGGYGSAASYSHNYPIYAIPQYVNGFRRY
ncbi:uncharacterized protein LOC142226195 [Haematobia irritans]|uniref:uncharacterized protein LOC142226195 n=1 Tax=Haematobia irritans TaxID=7368 RepID=UPI003F506209